MKASDLLIFILGIAGALAGYFLLQPPLSWAAVGICAAFTVWTLLAADAAAKPVLRLAGLSWSMEDFVRGWLITGRTGSGKTQCAINTITHQIFQNVPHWGGVCLDQKGLYWEILVRMAAHFGREGDLVLLQTRPLGKDELWRPVHTINITGNPNVPASTYAKVIVDTAVSLTGGRGQNPFFPTKAQIAIQTGFEVLRHMEAYVTIPNFHRLLLNEADANAAIETLMNKGDQRSHELVVALRDGFFGQPPEQLGGVQGTLSTYLEFFTDPEIAEVFCANEPTFSIGEIDAGKIVCIAMPQKFQSERLYINTILKLSYYFHALSRFDKPTEEREKANLIVLFADEGQEIITGAESAFADHRAAGVIREARATMVFATQAYTSLHGSLDRRYADVLMLNLSNELIFTCANHDSALIASKNIGEREVVEKTWGWAAGKPTSNYQRVIKPYFPAFKLRKLPKFTAIVRHCERPFRKRLIPPIKPDGSYPKWFTWQRPDYAARQWLKLCLIQTCQPLMNTHSSIGCDLSDLESHLLSRIKGQGHVIPRVCSVLERGQLGLQPTGKPLGSLLFLGPTGVGKTQLTLEFARYLFGPEKVHHFDMSEFLHLDSVKLFMGDETGNVGRLGRVLSQYQRGVVLFDEIEKSHRLIWDLLLQMLDSARITLADHRAYDLSGFYIVCTSNIGSQQLLRPTRLPFTTLERAVISELHGFFRPELIGRFDEKIVFRPLCPDTQREIARLAIAEELTRFRELGFDLTVSDEAFEFLVRRGIRKALGARPMKKTVQKFIGDAVRDAMKAGAQSCGLLTVSPLHDRLTIMQ